MDSAYHLKESCPSENRDPARLRGTSPFLRQIAGQCSAAVACSSDKPRSFRRRLLFRASSRPNPLCCKLVHLLRRPDETVSDCGKTQQYCRAAPLSRARKPNAPAHTISRKVFAE